MFLNVPFAEKDFAKKLGARWDPVLKKWYMPLHHPKPEIFQKWMISPSPAMISVTAYPSPSSSFPSAAPTAAAASPSSASSSLEIEPYPHFPHSESGESKFNVIGKEENNNENRTVQLRGDGNSSGKSIETR